MFSVLRSCTKRCYYIPTPRHRCLLFINPDSIPRCGIIALFSSSNSDNDDDTSAASNLVPPVQPYPSARTLRMQRIAERRRKKRIRFKNLPEVDFLEKRDDREWLLDGWYRSKVEQRLLHHDPAQQRACYRLQKLQKLIQNYDNWPVRLWRKQEDLERKKEAERQQQQQNEDKEEEDPTTVKVPPPLTEGKPGHERDLLLKCEDRSEALRIRILQQKAMRQKKKDDDWDNLSSDEEEDKDLYKEVDIFEPIKVPHPNPELPPQVPRGFYLYGGVGTGKSNIMNAFYGNVGLDRKKKRFHMHEFLADIHTRILRLQNPRNPKAISVGREYAREFSLFYLDEFQLVDVADTVLVQQVLGEMLRLGTVLVATSNRSPEGLMEAGLFHVKPVVELIRKYCIVHEMASNFDYRQHMHQDKEVEGFDETKIPNTYFVTEEGNDRKQEVEYLLHQIMGHSIKGVPEPIRLDTLPPDEVSPLFPPDELPPPQRSITMTVYRKHDIAVGVCSFTKDLSQNKGVSDYRALAKQLDVLILYDLPYLSDGTTAQADTTRRFISLIDELYEWRRPIICTSPVARPAELFTSVYANDDTEAAPVGVDDLRFAFPRAASRLMELTSPEWWRLVYDYFDFHVDEPVDPEFLDHENIPSDQQLDRIAASKPMWY